MKIISRMVSLVKELEACTDSVSAFTSLTKFNSDNLNRFEFPELDVGDRERIGSRISCWLHDLEYKECYLQALIAIRILSRDKNDVNSLGSRGLVEALGQQAGYLRESLIDLERLEAKKALCNLTFHSETARKHCEEIEGFVDSHMVHVDKVTRENEPLRIPDEEFIFDLRLLFLLTALVPAIRGRVGLDLGGVQILTRGLEQVLTSAGEGKLTITKVDVALENLKAFFNLSLLVEPEDSAELFKTAIFSRMADIFRQLLIVPVTCPEKQLELRGSIVNVLTRVPPNMYDSLTAPYDSTNATAPHYDGYDMSPIQEMLVFLHQRLQLPPTQHVDSLVPILSLLISMASHSRRLRKYMRFRILPPRKDPYVKPEVGTSLRSCLVRHMTGVSDVKNLAAVFLFELCKRNVDRLIKYTGFGNAVGMLVDYGLMGKSQKLHDQDYSDDEDSSTEEYEAVRDQINPVIGAVEPKRPDPLEGMSEEQKEYEIMELVNKLDRLTREGVIKPARVLEDGSLRAVDHVLELQQGMDPDEIDNVDE